VRLWDARSRQALIEPIRFNDDIRSARLSLNGKQIVTACLDETRIWDAQTGKPLTEPIKHAAEVKSVRFDPSGKRIVAASGKQVQV
jgi:WD40 repeat protein